jgi:class 3 adenylate cyclase
MVAQQHNFLFADIAGYSAYAERAGDDAAADLAVRFASEVATLAAEHGAELLKLVGDAVLVHAFDAARTIRLGLCLGERLAEAGLPQVHIGIHTGPAVKRAGDWWGTTVNVAARVMAAAGAGEVLVTEATVSAANAEGDADLRSLGPRSFKNISTPVWLYSSCSRPLALAA